MTNITHSESDPLDVRLFFACLRAVELLCSQLLRPGLPVLQPASQRHAPCDVARILLGAAMTMLP